MSKPVRHGSKWRIRWIDHTRERQSAVLGSYREAEAALVELQSKANRIRRGLEQPIDGGKTFGELCETYLANQSSQKRRYRDDECLMRLHLRPAFGRFKLTQLRKDSIDQYKISKSHLNPNTLHHHLTLLVSMLRYAHELRWIAEAPRIKKPKIPLVDKNFRYLKSEDEIRRFLHAAMSEGESAFMLYATAIYTGLRAGELAGLRWEGVDFDSRRITVKNSYMGPTKNGETRHVPILDPLLPYLQNWWTHAHGPFVFPTSTGTMLCPSSRIFKDTFHRVVALAGFPKIEEADSRFPARWYLNFHGMRHTFASLWMSRGGDLFKLQKILGHKDIKMTLRYSHLSPDAFDSEYGRLGAQPVLRPVAVG